MNATFHRGLGWLVALVVLDAVLYWVFETIGLKPVETLGPPVAGERGRHRALPPEGLAGWPGWAA